MRKESLSLLLGGWLWLITTSANAQHEQDPNLNVPTSAGVLISVLAQPRQIDLPGTFNIALRIQNTSPDTLFVNNFRFAPVDSPTPLEVSKNCDSESPQEAIDPNKFYTIICTISTPGYKDTFASFLLSMISRWSLLTLASNEYQFAAMANVEAETREQSKAASYITTSTAIQVRLTPTVWQSVFGAMLGSLLMVIFWLSSPKVQSQVGVSSAGIGNPPQILTTLGRAVALWSGSTTAAAISIFLTFRMKDASLPFTLSVNDFYGGLVVGLFGVVLTNWLGPKLFDRGSGKP